MLKLAPAARPILAKFANITHTIKESLTYRFCPRETSYVRLGEGRGRGGGGEGRGGGGAGERGGGLAAVTFLCKTWKKIDSFFRKP